VIEPALSPREQWALLAWMFRHPSALVEDTGAPADAPVPPGRATPRAYQCGLLCGCAASTIVLALLSGSRAAR
jgi:hypothetical protein